MDMRRAWEQANTADLERFNAQLIAAGLEPHPNLARTLALCQAIQSQRFIIGDFHLSGRSLASYIWGDEERGEAAITMMLALCRAGILELVSQGNKKARLATLWRYPQALRDCQARNEERASWQRS